MSYELRRAEIRRRQRNGDADPELAMGDHFAVAMAARSQSSELQNRAPVVKAQAKASPSVNRSSHSSAKPWADAFFKASENAGLPLATLNAIVHVSSSKDEAMAQLHKRSSDPDHIVKRIGNAYAKAHQPDLRSHRR